MPVTLAEGVTFTDAAANMAGLLRGFPDGAFRPGSNATGAEMTTKVYRLMAQR